MDIIRSTTATASALNSDEEEDSNGPDLVIIVPALIVFCLLAFIAAFFIKVWSDKRKKAKQESSKSESTDPHADATYMSSSFINVE